MSQTPTESPYRWRAADLEGIRVALSVPARLPAIRAINDDMAELEEQYPDAIPTARRELEAIAGALLHLLAHCHGDDRQDCPILEAFGGDATTGAADVRAARRSVSRRRAAR